MPNYKTHLVGGVVTFCIILLLIFSSISGLKIATLFQYLSSCLIGSLFPDVDTKSKIQKLFYTVLLCIFIITLVQGSFTIFVILTFIGILPLIVHHRGLFHKPLFIASIALIAVLICCLYAPKLQYHLCLNLLFFVSGAFSHIILDIGVKRFFRI